MKSYVEHAHGVKKNCTISCKEIRILCCCWCEEIFAGRELGCSRRGAAESFSCAQMLYCHICGGLNVLQHIQTYPDREAPQTYCKKYRKNTLTYFKANYCQKKCKNGNLGTDHQQHCMSVM
jgi:hypothetical protein